MKICRVLIEHGFLDQQIYDYSFEGFEVEPYLRVRIPFAKREIVGLVLEITEVEENTLEYELKSISGIIDEKPIYNDAMNEMALWLSQQYCSPLIMAYQTILPNKIRPSSTTKRPKLKKVYTFKAYDESETSLGKKLLDQLKEIGTIDAHQFKESPGAIKRLISKGLIEVTEVEATYHEALYRTRNEDVILNHDQKNCVDHIVFSKHEVSLLHGVTGSGKTEVYMTLCDKALSLNKQALIMVPEIALTPQMISRFRERFGLDVGVYHSALNDQEKYEQYQRVKKGEVQIVIGTRSSVFLPFSKLGLIVVDEEHDTSYKNGTMPFYHARDVAIYRGLMFDCPVLLGSASPSFESYARALKGVYQLLEMPRRVYDQMPVVNIIDMRNRQQSKRSNLISETLCTAIDLRLNHQEQVILMLNRRGYNTLVKCNVCEEVICCPHCDVALTYHKENRMYQCHTCGFQKSHVQCSKGHPGQLVGSGVGTQMLAEECQRLFPNARIGRFDYDTTRQKNGHGKILKQFENKEIDILIGTQMIAKGIDVSAVTQVGILSADSTLMREDYRSSEMTFDLLLQASGRSGRGSKKGEVIIQTYNPDHYAIQCATHHDYKRFFAYEMKYRQLAQYPPYTYLIAITLVDQNQEKVERYAQKFSENFKTHDTMKCLGPATLLKKADFYRTRFILKGKDLEQMRDDVRIFIANNPDFRSRIKCLIDINPMILEA